MLRIDELKRALAFCRVSQGEVAKHLGKSRQHINAKMNSKLNFHIEEMLSLIDFLNFMRNKEIKKAPYTIYDFYDY